MRASVASFNCHLGVDGWGRPYDVVGACRRIDADLLAIEENFVPADGASVAATVAAELGYTSIEVDLAGARLLKPLDIDPPPGSWGPGVTGGGRPRVLALDERRPTGRYALPPDRAAGARRGRFGLAVLSRLPIQRREIVAFARSPRDPVARKAILLEIGEATRPLRVAAVHCSHLSRGSPRQFAALRHQLDGEEPSLLLGDLNCWGPPLALLLPGWRRAVRGRTWPAWRPHSQVDHVLLRGSVRALEAQVLPPLGSDHRAVRAELTW